MLRDFIKTTGVIISSGRGGGNIKDFVAVSPYIELINGIKIIKMNDTSIGELHEEEVDKKFICSYVGLSGKFYGRWGTYSPAGYYVFYRTCGGWNDLFFVGEELPPLVKRFPLYEKYLPNFIIWEVINLIKLYSFEIHEFVPQLRDFFISIEKKEDRRRILEFLPKEVRGEFIDEYISSNGEPRRFCYSFKKRRNSKIIELNLPYERRELKYIEAIPNGFRWKGKWVEVVIYEDKKFEIKDEIMDKVITGLWEEE